MAGTIKTVTDRSEFDSIFYDNFPNNDVFLKTSTGNMKISFLGYTGGQVAFRIPYIKSMPLTALVFTRRNEVTIYAEIRTIEKQEAEVFVFAPVRMPTLCCRPGLMLTPPPATSSAYFGTSCMSMKGDLPGLSKCCCGTIGSYQ